MAIVQTSKKKVFNDPQPRNTQESGLVRNIDFSPVIDDIASIITALNSIFPSSGVLAANTINEFTTNNGVTVDGAVIKDGQVLPASGTVTQLTSIATGVTLNQPSGAITTVNTTLAANTATSFVFTNSFITASSKVIVSISSYSGTLITNGVPMVQAGVLGAGSVVINVINIHPTNALAGTLRIQFVIF